MYDNFHTSALADLGGAAGAPPPPQQDQFLLFSHMFLPKSVHVGGWRPPMGRRPPNGKSWIHHWSVYQVLRLTSGREQNTFVHSGYNDVVTFDISKLDH